jgi:hypothetical protein
MNVPIHRPINEGNTAVVLNRATGNYEIICLDTGEVVNVRSSHDLSKYKFDFDQGLRICQAIREGKTLQSIAADESFPDLHVISYWRKINATFDEEIKLARKQRAEYYHDKVIELANTVDDDSNVAVAKFKAEQYRWAAEKGDPGSYGNKIEHTGSNTATSIVVYTGIERRPVHDVIEADKAVITEVTDGEENTSSDRQQD